MGHRAQVGDVYYLTLEEPAAAGDRGKGAEIVLLQRVERALWVACLPNRGLVRVNLSSGQVNREYRDDIDYDTMNDIPENELRALNAAIPEFLAGHDDGGGVVAAGGAVGDGDHGGGALRDGGGAEIERDVPRPARAPLPPRYLAALDRNRNRQQGRGRFRRTWRYARQRPVESAAGVGGVCLSMSKGFAYLKQSGYYESVRVEMVGAWAFAKEHYVELRSYVKDMGWDGVLLALIMLFLVIKILMRLFGNAGGANGRPTPGGYHGGGGGGPGWSGGGGGGGSSSSGRRPGGGRPGAGVGEFSNRINNYQGISQDDRRGPGAGAGASAPQAPGAGPVLKRAMARIGRVKRMAVNPMVAFALMLEAIIDYADWPFPAECSERLAGEYLAQVYASGRRGVYYAREFARDHGMEGTTAALILERIFLALDELLLFDNFNVCNSAGAEVLARWAYGIEKAHMYCSKKEHVQGDAKARKTRWDLFDRYDVLSCMKNTSAVTAADEEVSTVMKRDALFLKYLERQQNGN